jgi:hypothetical protein
MVLPISNACLVAYPDFRGYGFERFGFVILHIDKVHFHHSFSFWNWSRMG